MVSAQNPAQHLAGRFRLTILAGVGIALTPGRESKHTRRELSIGTLFCILAALGGASGAVLSRKA